MSETLRWAEMTVAERLRASLNTDVVVRRWQDGLDVESAVRVLQVTSDAVHLASIPGGVEMVVPLADVISVEKVPE